MPPAPPIVRLAVAFYGVLFAAAVAWATLADRPLVWAGPAARARGVDLLLDPGAGALVALVVIVVSAAFTRWTRSGERLARALAALLGRRTAAECLVLALASGIAEEAFFRGAMQPALGLGATSALFALAHFAPRRELLPWTGFALAAGVVLGLLFEATGNLLAPVVAHVLVNAVNLWWLSRDYAPA